MKLPNWLKILWWLGITATLTFFLWARLPGLLSGTTTAADIAVFAVWMALLLAPLFNEVSLLGITLKTQLDELKETVTTQLSEIKTEFQSAVEVRTTLSQQFNMPAPMADAQLPQLEERVKEAVRDALATHGPSQASSTQNLSVEKDIAFLFSVRFNLEKEIRRIAAARQVGSLSRRGPVPTMQLIRALSDAELLEPKLAAAIREVYLICSPAVHGEDVTEAQVQFVRDIGAHLVAALSSIH